MTFLKAAFIIESIMFTSSSGLERSISGGSELAPREYPSPVVSWSSVFGFLIGGRLVWVVNRVARHSLTRLRFFQAALTLTSVESRGELGMVSSRNNSELNALNAS